MLTRLIILRTQMINSRKSKYLVTALLLTGTFACLTTTTFGQTNYSQDTGSTSTDYQPPTRNPQDNAGANLQQSPVGLQPIPGSSSLTQESLPVVENLQVLGSNSQANPNTTSTYQATVPRSSNRFIPVLLTVLAVIAAVYYFVIRDTNTNPVALEQPDKLTKKPKSGTKKTKKSKKNNKKARTRR